MKKVIKAIVFGITYAAVLPAGLLSKLSHRLCGSSLCFDFFAQAFGLVPGIPGVIVRACYYKQTLRKAYLDLDIGFGSLVSKADTELGRGILITSRTTVGFAKVGDNAVIANYVSILSGRYQHNFTDVNRNILDGQDIFSPVVIGENSFIGEHSTVMANVGCYAIVGAGSVVTKDIGDFVVAAGNPARVVKERPRPELNRSDE